MQTPKVIPVEIDLVQTQPVVYESCQTESFLQALMLRKVSALLSSNGQAGYYPIHVFCCAKCGHVNSEFMPEELRKNIVTAKS